ncbi:hypothetical protein CMK18_09605 [Candidatus Poribacteria bacterium]|nr:hypothetical protein [Candidatus Poribacteria bacterium]
MRREVGATPVWFRQMYRSVIGKVSAIFAYSLNILFLFFFLDNNQKKIEYKVNLDEVVFVCLKLVETFRKNE